MKKKTMMMVIAICSLLVACGDLEEMECSTEIECSEDKESFCDPATIVELDGESVEVKACTYITYEHCFEKTVCREIEGE